jgi:hypothetical protein
LILEKNIYILSRINIKIYIYIYISGFVTLLNNAGALDLGNASFSTPPTCDTAPVLDSDLANKAYVDSKSTVISNVSLSSYSADLNTTTGNLNITLGSNTLNYCLNNLTTSNYYSFFNLGASSNNLVNVVNNSVSAIAIDSLNNVYIGGTFTSAGGVNANYIAKWNGTSWSVLGSGMNGQCSAIAIDSSNNVYAGGSFTNAGGVNANRIAKWNGTSWSALGSGLAGFTGVVCNAIAIDSSNNVYAGGTFTNAGGISATNIAKWNGSIWSALGSGLGAGGATSCNAIAIDSLNNVYVGGSFTTSGTTTINRIAKWVPTGSGSWSALGSGLLGTCNAIAIDSSNNVYAGGSFNIASGINANCIAKWNGSTWSALGSGLAGAGAVFCNAIAIDSSNNVYAGGQFTIATNPDNSIVISNRIAKWDGSSWSSLNSLVNGNISAVKINSNNKLYIGGVFTINNYYIASYERTLNLSVNNKSLYSMKTGDVINVDVTNNGTPYTNGLAF